MSLVEKIHQDMVGAMKQRAVERLSTLRMEVIAQPVEGELVDGSVQAKQVSALATPLADNFLALAIVVRRRIVAFGVTGTILLRYANHASILL